MADPGPIQERPNQREYDSERDMEVFWSEIRPKREPMQQAWFLPVIFILLVLSIPWYRQSGEIGTVVAGLPAWVWIALLSSAALATVTAAMSLFFWDDDEDGE